MDRMPLPVVVVGLLGTTLDLGKHPDRWQNWRPSIAENATISKSAVQSLYKDCLKFPELQPSDFPARCKSTLKRSFSISDVAGASHQEMETFRTCAPSTCSLRMENSARLASRRVFSWCNSAKFLAKTESAANVPMGRLPSPPLETCWHRITAAVARQRSGGP